MTDTKSNGPDNSQERVGERIAKVLARAGVGSRRDVEAMISAGRISLDGTVINSPATFLTSVEGIKVDGEAIRQPQTQVLYRFHKPRGVITTHKDPQGRRTVFNLLPKKVGRLISVGRLDLNSEGLMLMTNDGALAHALESPSAGIKRLYRVRAHGRIDEGALEKLKNGITIDGIAYGAIIAKLERKTGQNSWLTMALEEGKNREIRKVLSHLGLTVNRLIRTEYGGFKLGSLPREGLAIVPPAQVQSMLSTLGIAQAPAEQTDKKGWAKAKAKPKKPPSRRRTMQQKKAKPGAEKASRQRPNHKRP